MTLGVDEAIEGPTPFNLAVDRVRVRIALGARSARFLPLPFVGGIGTGAATDGETGEVSGDECMRMRFREKVRRGSAGD